jgi:hypothetical protein
MLWVTFELAGNALDTSPFLEYFPSSEHKDEYYNALQEADAGYLGRLVHYFSDRMEQAVAAAEGASDPDLIDQ